jgi:hypothetical protein
MKELSFYQKYQLALLTMVISLFVVLIIMRICGVDLPDDLQGYMTTIWAIILLLVDAKGLHSTFTKLVPGESTMLESKKEILGDGTAFEKEG